MNNSGIKKIDKMILEYLETTKKNTYFNQKRNKQNKFWLLSTIEQQLKANFYQNPRVKKALQKEIDQLENGKTTPFNAAKRLLNL